MKLKNYKLVQCTLDEYNLINSLVEAHCIKKATELFLEIMLKTKIRFEYSKEELEKIAYNCIQAVRNNYKYLKVN